MNTELKTGICGGVIGAMVVVVAALLSSHFFDFKEILIINASDVTDVKTLFSETELLALDRLKTCGLLLTPTEYMGHLSNFYNFFIAFLSIIFVFASWIRVVVSKDHVEVWVKESVNKNIRGIAKDVREEMDSYVAGADEFARLVKKVDELEKKYIVEDE